MYKYDLHVHTNVGSLCGRSSPEDMVFAYSKAGYNGIVITDHFIKGNTAVPRNLPWKERIEKYYEAFQRAKTAARTLDNFNVLFGGEYAYADGHEILIYGLEKEFLLEHPEIDGLKPEELCKLLTEGGCVSVKAHPFRVRIYNDTTVSAETYFTDGIEVYNSCNTDEENSNALIFAKENKKLMTSGGDIHLASDPKIGKSGILTETPIKTQADLAAVLLSGNYKLIVEGKILNL